MRVCDEVVAEWNKRSANHLKNFSPYTAKTEKVSIDLPGVHQWRYDKLFATHETWRNDSTAVRTLHLKRICHFNVALWRRKGDGLDRDPVEH